MASKKHLAVAIPATAVTGTAVDISDMTSVTFQISGTGTYTMQLMQSLDGTNFTQLGADKTAATIISIGDGVSAIRVDATVATAIGTLAAAVGGLKQTYR